MGVSRSFSTHLKVRLGLQGFSERSVLSIPNFFCIKAISSGTVYDFDTPEYNAFIPSKQRQPGLKSFDHVTVHKVATVRFSDHAWPLASC